MKAAPSLVAAALLLSGCASPDPRPLRYLAAERPVGPVVIQPHTSVRKEFSRSGWYFLNYNFRPAASVEDYVRSASDAAETPVLKDADVKLVTPFALDILLFGYSFGTDSVKAR